MKAFDVEAKMRCMGQRAIIKAIEEQSGTLKSKSKSFVGGQGNLANKQRSFDPGRLDAADKTTTNYKCARTFQDAHDDDSHWKIVQEEFGL